MPKYNENVLDYYLLERLIRNAFNAGEAWGVTQGGWFIPDKEETEEQFKKVLRNARRNANRYNIWIVGR